MSRGRKKFLHNHGEENDDQFEAFLKESMSSEESSLDTGRISKYLEAPKKTKNSLWRIEDEEEEENIFGLSGTGRKFLKKDPKPAARKQVSPSPQKRDSLDDESLRSLGRNKMMEASKSGVPTLNLAGSSLSLTETSTDVQKRSKDVASLKVGKETMDELADKDRFFKEMERDSNSTVDYSRLNRELDGEGTVAFDGSVLDNTASNEFRDFDGNIQKGNEEDQDGMLAKVALMDSLDSTMGSKPRTSKDPDREMNTIHEGDDKENAFGYTNTSHDMEAIHNIYKKQVGMGTIDGEEFTLKDSSTIGGKSSVFTTQKTEAVSGDTNTPPFGLNPVVPNEADNRTVDDILREAKEYKPATKYSTRPSVHFKEDMDGRGLDVSGTDKPSGALDLSPIAKSKSRDTSFNSSALEKVATDQVAQMFDSSQQQESTPKNHGKSQVRDPFSHIKSSGYGQKSSKPLWSPGDIQKHKTRDSEVRPPLKTTPKRASPHRGRSSRDRSARDSRHKNNDWKDDTTLMNSVQTFTEYLQKHLAQAGLLAENNAMSTAAPQVEWSRDEPALSSSQKLAVLEREQHILREVKDWQEHLRQEKKIQAKLKIELDAKEREQIRTVEQLKMDHEKQIFKLKQENYILSAQITEERPQRHLVNGNVDDDSNTEQVKLMEREIQEQEKLLAGYQQENERIYQEMKKMQSVSKTSEEKMFKENQRLQNEVVSLRDNLNRKELELRNKGLITSPAMQQNLAGGDTGDGGSAILGANRIAQLEAGLKEAKKREEGLLLEIESYKQGKRDLETQLDMMVNEVKQLEGRVENARQFQNKQDQDKHAVYEAEIDKLNRKLKWYAENQVLLDKDAQVIKKKDDDIRKLRVKLQELQTESGRKAVEMKTKTKERASEAKRVQDLERQVKEMETILRKRHPNSLPVLMWAASNAPDVADGNKSASMQFLESRIKKLEAELSDKDEEEKRSLRSLEQKYNAMKFQYEERIEDLECRLGKYERAGDQRLKEGERPHSHVTALQKELDSCRDRHKKETTELKTEIEKRKKYRLILKNKEHGKGEMRHKDGDVLHSDHSKHKKENHMLRLQVENLQKDKQLILSEAAKHGGRIPKSLLERLETKRGRSSRPKSAGSVRTPRSLSSEPVSLPVYTDDIYRDKYEPQSFAGQHVSETLSENQHLKHKCEELEIENSHQRVTITRVCAEAEARDRKLREEFDDQLRLMKESHQSEVQRLLTERAMEYSSSKVAEMTSKLDTQEVVMRHLKDQLSQSKVDGEELAAIKIRETTLESQMRQLMDELHEAKKNHSPEMRHFEALQRKIVQLESRHAQREQEVKQIIQQTRLSAHANLNAEIDKWKALVESKNKETESFRAELDSILGILRELQRQGVLLPYKSLNNHFR